MKLIIKKESTEHQIEQQTKSKIADTNTVVKTGEDNESKAELLNQEESRGEEMENSTRTEKQNNPEEINQENEFMGGFILPTSNEEEDKCDDDDFSEALHILMKMLNQNLLMITILMLQVLIIRKIIKSLLRFLMNT